MAERLDAIVLGVSMDTRQIANATREVNRTIGQAFAQYRQAGDAVRVLDERLQQSAEFQKVYDAAVAKSVQTSIRRQRTLDREADALQRLQQELGRPVDNQTTNRELTDAQARIDAVERETQARRQLASEAERAAQRVAAAGRTRGENNRIAEIQQASEAFAAGAIAASDYRQAVARADQNFQSYRDGVAETNSLTKLLNEGQKALERQAQSATRYFLELANAERQAAREAREAAQAIADGIRARRAPPAAEREQSQRVGNAFSAFANDDISFSELNSEIANATASFAEYRERLNQTNSLTRLLADGQKNLERQTQSATRYFIELANAERQAARDAREAAQAIADGIRARQTPAAEREQADRVRDAFNAFADNDISFSELNSELAGANARFAEYRENLEETNALTKLLDRGQRNYARATSQVSQIIRSTLSPIERMRSEFNEQANAIERLIRFERSLGRETSTLERQLAALGAQFRENSARAYFDQLQEGRNYMAQFGGAQAQMNARLAQAEEMFRRGVIGPQQYALAIKRIRYEASLTARAFDALRLGVVGFIDPLNIAYRVIEQVTQGIRNFAEFQRASARFEVFTGSVEGAVDVMNDLRRISRSSPITFQGAQQAASTMFQFGVASDEVVKRLEQIGEITGGDNDRLRQMALAFAQVQAAGRLMGQEVIQLVNSGFNPLQEISLQTGRSMRDLKKDVEEGAISYEMVAKAFDTATAAGGRYNGTLDRIADTTAGQLAVAGSAVEELQIALGELFEGELVGLLNTFIVTIRGVTDVANAWGNVLDQISGLLKDIAVNSGTLRDIGVSEADIERLEEYGGLLRDLFTDGLSLPGRFKSAAAALVDRTIARSTGDLVAAEEAQLRLFEATGKSNRRIADQRQLVKGLSDAEKNLAEVRLRAATEGVGSLTQEETQVFDANNVELSIKELQDARVQLTRALADAGGDAEAIAKARLEYARVVPLAQAIEGANEQAAAAALESTFAFEQQRKEMEKIENRAADVFSSIKSMRAEVQEIKFGERNAEFIGAMEKLISPDNLQDFKQFVNDADTFGQILSEFNKTGSAQAIKVFQDLVRGRGARDLAAQGEAFRDFMDNAVSNSINAANEIRFGDNEAAAIAAIRDQLDEAALKAFDQQLAAANSIEQILRNVKFLSEEDRRAALDLLEKQRKRDREAQQRAFGQSIDDSLNSAQQTINEVALGKDGAALANQIRGFIPEDELKKFDRIVSEAEDIDDLLASFKFYEILSDEELKKVEGLVEKLQEAREAAVGIELKKFESFKEFFDDIRIDPLFDSDVIDWYAEIMRLMRDEGISFEAAEATVEMRKQREIMERILDLRKRLNDEDAAGGRRLKNQVDQLADLQTALATDKITQEQFNRERNRIEGEIEPVQFQQARAPDALDINSAEAARIVADNQVAAFDRQFELQQKQLLVQRANEAANKKSEKHLADLKKKPSIQAAL